MPLNIRSQYSTGRYLSQHRPQWSVFGSIMRIFFLALQLFVPLAGQAANSGDWIETCSEFGAIEIEIETDGMDTSDCPVCALSTPSHAVAGAPMGGSVCSDAAPLSWVPYKVDLAVQSPAQFWPDSRSPPLDKRTASDQPSSGLVMSFRLKGEAS